MEPINYMAMVPQVNLGQQFAELGQVIAERRQRVAAEEAQKAYASDLQSAIDNPTQATWSAMIAKYPKQREAFESARKGFGEERVKNDFNSGFEISLALENGRPDVAKQRIQTILEAKKNSNQPAGIYQQVFDALESGNVKGAQAGVNLALSILDPVAFKNTVDGRVTAEKAPSEISEAASKAQKAAVAAKFAESDAVIDLQKKGWDITKIQEDIKIAKQNSQIAAMNAATAREGNSLKRQENQIKLQEMIDKRDSAVREKSAEVQSARTSMDNMLNTADRILKTPMGVVGAAAGPVSSRMPTLTQGTADFEALVETLGSQAFMAQIPNLKGMGALSNAEGEKLQAALQNFSLKQSPERLLENVREAQRLVIKGRKNLADKYGIPDTVQDRPSITTAPADIDALVKKYGGK